ncbi:hypothetical protein GYA27_02420 [candidate division WWE3 bacterium]|uniref:Uncharacterized protein n=1 Tax=candidate division WWE3 bacterium TaxID=2053526 RepID=A0A7X9DKC7_UNCKA|nr:hypothetical protein [candidate division WWE3 bacterium]
MKKVTEELLAEELPSKSIICNAKKLDSEPEVVVEGHRDTINAGLIH